MRIAVGSDHRGYAVRAKVIDLVQRLGHEVEDSGTDGPDSVDYPDIAAVVAGKLSRGEVDRAILICGTGLGMWITKRLVEMMNGTIMVDSIENVGTQITLQFPVVKK